MEEKVKCEICGKYFRVITECHLKTHGITFKEYKILFPDAKTTADDVYKKQNKIRRSPFNEKKSEIMKAVLANGEIVARTNKTKAQRRFLIRFFREMRTLEQVAYGNLVKCEICGIYFRRISPGHLINKHGITLAEYKELFPGSLTRAINQRVENLKSTKISDARKRLHAIANFFKLRAKYDCIRVGDCVVCEICGEIMRNLKQHLLIEHNLTTEEYKEQYPLSPVISDNTIIRLRESGAKQIPRFTNTIIEVMVQDILKAHGYKFETQFPVCLICRPDIVFPEKKIAIFCDGDYWHNLPGYPERDKNQNRVLKMNGWKVIRFWEHEIHENIQDCLRKFEAIYNDTEYVPYHKQKTLDNWM